MRRGESGGGVSGGKARNVVRANRDREDKEGKTKVKPRSRARGEDSKEILHMI